MTNINIIYFIWINKLRPYKLIIEGQLEDVIKSNILSVSKLYIVVSCDQDIKEEIENIIQNALNKYNKYEIEFNYENTYEYKGFKKLYDLALKEPNKIYLYLHSKGMFSSYGHEGRTTHEIRLTRGHVYKYLKVLEIFESDENIINVSMFPGDLFYGNNNYSWFNFFYIKGSYLATCYEPIVSNDNRFYYEFYIGKNKINNLNYKCYNLLTDNFNKVKSLDASQIIGSNKIDTYGNYIM
jgi:hypothetical protein